MSEEISRIASEFLARYLSNNPSVEFHKLVCPAERYEIHDSHEAAQDFLEQIQSGGTVESGRIDITDTAPVVIGRACQRHVPSYLAGTRRDGTLVWTHNLRLAARFHGDKAEAVLKALADLGIRAYAMPAPGFRHGSL